MNEMSLLVGMKHLLVDSELESPYKSYPSATVAVWGLPLPGLLVGSCWFHLGILLVGKKLSDLIIYLEVSHGIGT